MKHIAFDAVFDYLAEYEVKRMVPTIFDTLLVKILSQKSVFHQITTQYIQAQRFEKVRRKYSYMQFDRAKNSLSSEILQQKITASVEEKSTKYRKNENFDILI